MNSTYKKYTQPKIKVVNIIPSRLCDASPLMFGSGYDENLDAQSIGDFDE